MLYGFHYGARVLLEDGTTQKLGIIVNQKKNVRVQCYNKETRKIEFKSIKNFHRGTGDKKFTNLKIKKAYDNGFSYVAVDNDAIFLTPNGYKHFKELKIGDKVYSYHLKYLNQEQLEFCVGSILGDGAMRTRNNNLTVSMRFKQGIKQNNYCDWKSKALSSHFIGSKGFVANGEMFFETKPTQELVLLNNKISIKDKWSIPQEEIELISPLSLAIWHLDDGSFGGSYAKWGNGKSFISASSMTVETLERIAKHIKEKYLLNPVVYNRASRGLYFYGKENFKFHSLIAKYVPKCMEYKLHPKLREIEKHVFNNSNKPEPHLIIVDILDIYDKPMNNSRSYAKFHLEIEDNHNFFVDGILVQDITQQ